jgi:hypothetical protein
MPEEFTPSEGLFLSSFFLERKDAAQMEEELKERGMEGSRRPAYRNSVSFPRSAQREEEPNVHLEESPIQKEDLGAKIGHKEKKSAAEACTHRACEGILKRRGLAEDQEEFGIPSADHEAQGESQSFLGKKRLLRQESAGAEGKGGPLFIQDASGFAAESRASHAASLFG